MNIIINILVTTVAALGGAYLLEGVKVSGFGSAIIFAVLLAVSNAIIKPILLFVSLPINFLTLGLFTFVINALIILLVNSLMTGFSVDGFVTALIFSIVLSLISSVLAFILGV